MSMLYELNDVTFDYGNGFRLSYINLAIEQGSFVAFVGPNGAGKSTLLNVLAMLSLPSSGQLTFLGKTVNKASLALLKKRVGYVQQNPYLLRGSVASNVELGLKLQHVDKVDRVKRSDAVMELIRIAHFQQRNVSELSGGEAQKVAIARALVLEPDVLILDEPFTFLDKTSIHELEKLLIRLQQDCGKTIILTTHNLVQAQQLADSIYSVTQGKVFASGLANLFSGMSMANNRFDTGNIFIQLPATLNDVDQIAIDPGLIRLSREQPGNGNTNVFRGRIISMIEDSGGIQLLFDAGEKFHVTMSTQQLQELGLLVGQEAWLSFEDKSIIRC